MMDTIISSNPLFTIIADTDAPVTNLMPINFEVTFMPTAAGQESAVITVVTDDCVVGDYTFTVQGNALPTVAFIAPADLCLNVGVQTGLGGGTPECGVCSGPGVTDDGNGMTYSFDPAAAGVGVHTITYSLQGATATDDVEVFASPDATFAPALTGVCPDAGIQSGLGGGMPEGGVYSGPGVTFTAPGPFTTNDGLQLLTGGIPEGGSYSGTGVTDNGDGTFTFDPSTGVGTCTIT